MKKTKSGKNDVTIGRLTAFGVSSSTPWQALLIAPNRYLDLRNVIRSGNGLAVNEEGSREVIEGYVSHSGRYDATKKQFIVRVVLVDKLTMVTVFIPGTPYKLDGHDEWRKVNTRVAMVGKLVVKPSGACVMFSATRVNPDHLGMALGVYPSKSGVIGSDRVRERVMAQMTDENIKQAANYIRQRFISASEKEVLVAWGSQYNIKNMDKTSLERVIRRLHSPLTPKQGFQACKLLTDIDAFCVLDGIEAERPKTGIFQQVVASRGAVEKRIKAIPFPLTDEQKQVVWDFLDDMAKGMPAHRLLSGDVGTGKSAPMAIITAAVYDAGGQVAVMLPSADIVEQMARDIEAWWPDITLSRITSKTKDDAITGRVRLGTTALIHRYADWQPTLTIVDEQQRMSVNQRHALTHNVGHLLEATATCLPRTQAQAIFGLIPVSRLTKPHTPKHIHTKVHNASDANEKVSLFQSINETLSSGEQVLVIYSARTRAEADKMFRADLKADAKDSKKGILPSGNGANGPRRPPQVASLDEGMLLWQEKFGAENVVTLHGKMKAKDRDVSLARMRDGSAKILCATTAAEVGLNIPLLRRVVVINPERLGLTQLHQIRGRVARNGGDGWCDLLADTDNLRSTSIERLEALCSTQDGFKLAEIDMHQRGLGDLSSRVNQQSGKLAGAIIRNSKLSLKHFETASSIMESIAKP